MSKALKWIVLGLLGLFLVAKSINDGQFWEFAGMACGIWFVVNLDRENKDLAKRVDEMHWRLRELEGHARQEKTG